MADNSNDLSGKVGLDTTDFKAGINELGRQIRVLNSDFKASAAGMENWATSEEGLEAKIKQLSSTATLHKQIVANLTAEYNRVAAKEGETSSAAEVLKIKLNNATAALNKNQLEISKNQSALEKMRDTTESTSDKLSSLDKELSVVQSGFNAATSGMKDYTSTTTGLKQKITELTQTADIHKQKLAILKSEYANVSEEQGKSSNAARDLKIQINDETSALNKNKTELSINKNMLADFGQELNGAATKAEVATAKLDNFTKKLSDVGSKTASVGSAMLPATAALGAAGVAAIKIGSDYNESLNKVEVAFDDSAKSVEAWSKTTIDRIGIASGTALDMTAQFGDMATSMEIPSNKAAEMSTKLTDLAGDLASYKNISLDVAKTGLNGIFTGETESLKQLGVVMTETNLKSFAMSEGIHKDYDEMSEAEKVTLRYNYVLEKTKNSQGDFANTSDSTANSTRTLIERAKELAISFRDILLPMITPLIKKCTEFTKSLADMSDGHKKAVVTIGLAVAALGPLLIGVGKVAQGVAVLSKMWTAATVTVTAVKAAWQTATMQLALFTAQNGVAALSQVAMTTSLTAGQVVVGLLTGKIGLATAAQTLWNIALSANPIGLVVIAIAALTASIALIISGIKELTGESNKQKVASAELTETVKTQTEAWNENRKATLENRAATVSEIDNTQKLWQELQTLVDGNGLVVGSKERVKFITEEINKLAPDSIEWVNGERIAYEDGAKAIENMIQLKRAEAILAAEEAGYKLALQNVRATETKQAEDAIKIQKAQQELDENGSKMSIASYLIKKAQLDKLKKDYGENETTYEQYCQQISFYETTSADIMAKNYDKVKTINENYGTSFKNAGTSTKAELVNQVNTTGKLLAQQEQRLKDGTKGITQATVDSAKTTFKNSVSQLYAAGLSMSDGVRKGWTANEKSLLDAVASTVTKMNTTAKKTGEIHSPSKLTAREVGKPLMQGIGVGFVNAASGVMAQMNKALPTDFNQGFSNSLKGALSDMQSLTNANVGNLAFSSIPSNSNSSSTQSASTTTVNHNYNYITIKADEIQEVSNLVRVLDSFEQVKNAGEVL